MSKWIVMLCTLCGLCLAGCNVDAKKIKAQGQGRSAGQRGSIRDATGVDLGTATPNRTKDGKLRLTTAPTDL